MSSSISLERSGSAQDIENQAQVEVKQPCCTWNCCCGSKMSWRDIIIIPTELVSGTAALATGAYGGVNANAVVKNTAFTVAAVFAAIFAIIVVVHICWRRDAKVADLTKTTNALAETGTELKDTAAKAQAAVEELTKKNEELAAQVVELKALPEKFSKENEDLKAEVADLETQVQGFGAQVDTLKEQNHMLNDQLERCKEAIDAITNHVANVNEANSKLATHVTDLSSNVGTFGDQNAVLKITVGSINESMDKKLELLKDALTHSQIIINESVKGFSQAIQNLQVQLTALLTAEKRVDLDEDDVRDRLAEFAKLNQTIEEKELALKVLENEFQKLTESYHAIQQAVTEYLSKLGTTETKLALDSEGLSKWLKEFRDLNLSGLEKRISIDIEALKRRSTKTENRIEEVDNL